MLSVADKWLAELLNILENTGVANETLVVIWGIMVFHSPRTAAWPHISTPVPPASTSP
ncbi:unnamed protein product [Penicillium camemberti]|uniref:Str. FM013 n=1 Tax=Penicillium camemberti (strain FM 013) TaxID=1429867 RepID=A0A0G4PPW7_PENC3|nr:unnamed protein product [Penicillium camemberti]